MVVRPGEVVWPNVGDPVLLVDLEPAPQDVQFRRSLDEVPSLGGFLDSAVEAEDMKESPLPTPCLFRWLWAMPAWPSIPRHCCQAGRSFRYRYASKLRSGSRWTRFSPLMRPLVMPVTTLAMSTSPCWRSSNASSSYDGMGRENIVPSGKMGLGQPPEPESNPLRLMISFLRFKVPCPAFNCAPE